MSVPLPGIDVPERVRALAGPEPLEPVWRNVLGGLTFRAGDRYVKWAPRRPGLDLPREAERLGWAGRFVRGPRVLAHGATGDEQWLVTEAIPAWSAVSEWGFANPAEAVRAVGAGLRAMHDAFPVAECPWDWSVPARIAAAAERGTIVPPELRDPPPIDRLVACHGDACCPNTLVDERGWAAHVDLGSLGVADRWADLAPAVWSAGYNFGPGWDGALLEAYGVDPDPARLDYYDRLWHAT
ncbi:phosphotransferase [Microbacterium sp. NPDC003461]